MDLTCLSNYPPLPIIPVHANTSNTFNHSAYKPNTGGLSQLISGSIISSTFSTNDIHNLLNKLLNKDISSWDVSEITKTPPVPSIIIYTSLALGLFLILSIIFCICSCTGSKKYRTGQKKRQSKTTQVCAFLLVFVYLFGIADIIYVAYRVNQTKTPIDNVIKEINRDVYPREIAEHLQYLNKQLNQLDQYCVASDSILIGASKFMLVKAFDQVLKEKYYILNISETVNNIDSNMRELGDEIEKNSTISPSAKERFKEFNASYESMIKNVQKPLTELCSYANSSNTDIDKKLLDALKAVHVQLEQVINTINKDLLSELMPWQNKMLMKTDFEEQIRGYISLGETIFMVLVLVLGGIPLIFFIFIAISRLCACCNNDDDDLDRIPMANMMNLDTLSVGNETDSSSTPYRYNTRNKVVPTNHHGKRNRARQIKSNTGPSGAVLCLMRIAFFVMMILLVILALVSGVYYVFDLVVQSSCQSVHNDQPYLINIISDKLVESNIIFGNRSEMNTTLTNLIHDCRDQVHYSRKLLENYWLTFDTDVKDMMNTLSKQIYDQFIQAMSEIDIQTDMAILLDFAEQAGIQNISMIVQRINSDLSILEYHFEKINGSNSTLPQNLTDSTINEFKDYVKTVLESTVDSCPLPLATISKTDILICHTMGDSISGLWLSVFFFLTLVTVGLSIFGVCVYKRLN